MELVQIIGMFCGLIALFFALSAGILYFKIKKFLSLITEEQLKSALPIFEKQRRRLYTFATVSCIFTIATVIISIVVNM
ncbi:MAG: hypothetical protein E7596_02920 [Ruminococcaceae bacterium]|nr:hypothetical protein [Oscillospiraceae bacterium]